MKLGTLSVDESNYGFPTIAHDFMKWVQENIPQNEHYTIYGMNWNIHRDKQERISGGLLDQLKSLNHQMLTEIGYGDTGIDIERNIRKTTINRG